MAQGKLWKISHQNSKRRTRNMACPSKQKGNRFEREVVNQAQELGLTAESAYASNGKSLGLEEDVDVLISKFKGQCKRRI